MFKTLTTASKIFGLLADLVYSNKEESERKQAQKRDSVGFSFGPTYGAGASYRKSLLGGKMGLQGTLCPPVWSPGQAFVAAGGTVFYNFSDITSWARPYVSFGVGGGIRRSQYQNIICPDNDAYDPTKITEDNIAYNAYYPGRPELPQKEGPDDAEEQPEIQECYYQSKARYQFLVGLGPALGIELRIQKLLTLNIELPLALSWTDSGFQIMPIPNVSIRADI